MGLSGMRDRAEQIGAKLVLRSGTDRRTNFAPICSARSLMPLSPIFSPCAPLFNDEKPFWIVPLPVILYAEDEVARVEGEDHQHLRCLGVLQHIGRVS